MATTEDIEGLETVNVHEAKTHLSRLLERVESGEEIVIARAGKPIARLVPLVPLGPPAPRTLFGRDRGKIWISGGEFTSLPPE